MTQCKWNCSTYIWILEKKQGHSGTAISSTYNGSEMTEFRNTRTKHGKKHAVSLERASQVQNKQCHSAVMVDSDYQLSTDLTKEYIIIS